MIPTFDLRILRVIKTVINMMLTCLFVLFNLHPNRTKTQIMTSLLLDFLILIIQIFIFTRLIACIWTHVVTIIPAVVQPFYPVIIAPLLPKRRNLACLTGVGREKSTSNQHYEQELLGASFVFFFVFHGVERICHYLKKDNISKLFLTNTKRNFSRSDDWPNSDRRVEPGCMVTMWIHCHDGKGSQQHESSFE